MAQKSGTLNRPMTFSAHTVVLFAFVFGLVGGYALFKSFAAKPSSGVTLTQTSAGTLSGAGTYSVQAVSKKMVDNKYSLWGAEICKDANSTVVSASYAPVKWPDQSSNTGTLGGFTTPPSNSSQCSVYVSLFPDVWTAVSNTATFNL